MADFEIEHSKGYMFLSRPKMMEAGLNSFRQNETSSLLRECTAGLQQALEVFKNSISVSAGISGVQEHSQKLHMALLEMLATFSDATSSETASRMEGCLLWALAGNSLSMLPPKPGIFHGRDSELTHIVDVLSQPVRIAILGEGGIGKTSLAKAVLHHPEITPHYKHRFFVVLDSATNGLDMVTIIGSYLGLEPEPDLTKLVVKYLQDISPCLLVLDNLESSWEPAESRNNVEEFLSLLTEVPQLALVVNGHQAITYISY
ncbi:P-loop containing nucleoside triphosphate hydrolase protein [Mycena latifolia]|nr:P-loop containing nucleoside triphosphate hydrolase protein [Mycena latifolia]